MQKVNKKSAAKAGQSKQSTESNQESKYLRQSGQQT
jgi:hypothetical protein